MRLLDYAPNSAAATAAIAQNAQAIANLQSDLNQGLAPVAGLLQTLNNQNAAILLLQNQVSALGGIATIPSRQDLGSYASPKQWQTLLVEEDRRVYRYCFGSFVAGGANQIPCSGGVWEPVAAVPDPNWIRCQDLATVYTRTLRNTGIISLSFEMAQRGDRSKTAQLTISDFATGYSYSGYWGINGRFYTVAVGGRNLTAFVGCDTATKKIMIAVQDQGLPAGDRFCWIRNVRINDLPADIATPDAIALSLADAVYGVLATKANV